MTGLRRWVDSLLLGMRFAVAGGRGGWTRAAMTALGVGIGVALLLVAASVPTLLHDRSARGTQRAVAWQQEMKAGDTTVVAAALNMEYRQTPIYSILVRPDGARPVIPPGLHSLPGPGQMVVSPALAKLLASADGALLRPRLPYRVVGTIGDQGLLGPTELAFYAGSDTITADDGGMRIDHFGDSPATDPLSPILVLLIMVGFVVLLLPVAIFIGTAVRFGGEGRDRRLAALRLVGADRAMARRISAGEALAGSILGVAVGVGLLFVTRALVPHVQLWDISVYSRDLRPNLVLAGLIVVVVPVLAVGVTLLALRRVSVEPLGVVRRAGGVRRRVWWRVVIPVAGVAVLYPALRQMRNSHSSVSIYPVVIGSTLLLIGVTTLLPWLVEAVVGRMRGGTVPWQLATRRLQLDSGTSSRLVSGIAVAVAGGIGLQMLFAGVQGGFVRNTGQDPTRTQVIVTVNRATIPVERLQAVPGVHNVVEFSQASFAVATAPDVGGTFVVADCATLLQLITIDTCTDGDVFLVPDPDPQLSAPLPAAGTQLLVGDPDAAPQRWTLPAGARPATTLLNARGTRVSGVVATTGALHGITLTDPATQAYLSADLADPDTIERIRNAAASINPLAQVFQLQLTKVDSKFANVRRGLLIGVTGVLLLIGASLLVSMLEQLRERRRLLSMLVAVGTKRTTLGWSLLWQATIPMLLGLALALVVGTGFGGLLLAMVSEPVRPDWADMGAISGVAALVVLLVTALSLPVLNRLMRSGGLRTE